MGEKCENCLDAPVKYSSMLVSTFVAMAGIASLVLVPYFGGMVSINNSTAVGNSTGCGDLSQDGGLSVLGFLLINHGLVATIFGLLLTMSWYFTDNLGILQGNISRSVVWFFSGTTLLGLGLTFYVPNLGGPSHVGAAVVYFILVTFSYLMSGLFCMRKCCSDVGKEQNYNSGAGGF